MSFDFIEYNYTLNQNKIMIQPKEFLEKFKTLFDETDESLIKFETKFKELDEWSSLTILSLIVMCEEFNTSITPVEIEKSVYVSDLLKFAENNINSNE